MEREGKEGNMKGGAGKKGKAVLSVPCWKLPLPLSFISICIRPVWRFS